MDKDGKIDYDIPGRLVGGWFLKGLPPGEGSSNADSGTKQLAFVYDMNAPGAIRISIGGILTMKGLFGVQSNSPDPSTVSRATGKVGYKLTNPFGPQNIVTGILIVQMTANDTIKVQTFQNVTADTTQFDANAAIYTR